MAGLSLQTDIFFGEIAPLMEFYPENPEEAKERHLNLAKIEFGILGCGQRGIHYSVRLKCTKGGFFASPRHSCHPLDLSFFIHISPGATVRDVVTDAKWPIFQPSY